MDDLWIDVEKFKREAIIRVNKWLKEHLINGRGAVIQIGLPKSIGFPFYTEFDAERFLKQHNLQESYNILHDQHNYAVYFRPEDKWDDTCEFIENKWKKIKNGEFLTYKDQIEVFYPDDYVIYE